MPTNAASQFWQWALSAYASVALQDLLLELQDRYGVVVLEVLLATWLARCGRGLSGQSVIDMRAVTDPWNEQVVKPLRTQRRLWKTGNSSLYAGAKALELEAEHILAQLMVAHCGVAATGIDAPEARQQGATRDLLAGNLRTLSPADPLLPDTILDRLMDALLGVATS